MPGYNFNGDEVNIASIGPGPTIIGAIGDDAEGSVTIGDDDETDSQ